MPISRPRGNAIHARVRNNAVLKRLALPTVDALAWEPLLAGRADEGDEPQAWVYEAVEQHRGGSWSPTRSSGARREGPCYMAIDMAGPPDLTQLAAGRGRKALRIGSIWLPEGNPCFCRLLHIRLRLLFRPLNGHFAPSSREANESELPLAQRSRRPTTAMEEARR